MDITAREISCIVSTETERLSKLVQQLADPLQDSNVAGYIVGIAQLSANIKILINNRESAGADAKTCWKCCNLLEVKESKDYNDQPVKACIECGAYIRD